MRTNILFTVLYVILFSVLPLTGIAQNTASNSILRLKDTTQVLNIQTYEDNLVGMAKNQNDELFLDAHISVVYQMNAFDYLGISVANGIIRLWNRAHGKSAQLPGDTLHLAKDSLRRQLRPLIHNPAPKSIIAREGFNHDFNLDVAFTEQFGFYINDRYSSPVVQKRFNPYLFFSFNPNHCSKKTFWRNLYTEFGYGHESNGQAIEDSATFASQVRNTRNKGTSFATAVQEASDYNSRGWDYWRLRAYENIPLDGAGRHCLVADVSFRWYLAYGFLEGKQENYRNWETAYGYTGTGLTRDQVSGLSCALSYLHRTPDDSSFRGAFNYTKLSLAYETGYKGAFEHNTLKVYAGFKLFFLPLALTYSYGFNTSVANYGVPVSSWGISLVLNSFSFPWLRQGIRKTQSSG